MALYECPSCKTKNQENINYCTNCGTWLLSENFPAKKVKGKLSDKFYICSFCDTANEPNRNACKKCMKPLFSTEYETKEITVKRRRTGRVIGWTIGWIIIILVVLGVIGSLNAPKESTRAASVVATQSPSVAPSESVKPSPAIGNYRSTPAPIGTAVTASLQQSDENFEVAIGVTKVVRGTEANKMVQQANQFNPKPDKGMEYLAAGISLKVVKSDNPDVQFQLSYINMTLVSTDGVDYPIVLTLVPPNPPLNAKLYEGASYKGWAVFQVRKDDPKPLIAYARAANGSGGVWFRTIN